MVPLGFRGREEREEKEETREEREEGDEEGEEEEEERGQEEETRRTHQDPSAARLTIHNTYEISLDNESPYVLLLYRVGLCEYDLMGKIRPFVPENTSLWWEICRSMVDNMFAMSDD